MFGPKPDTSSMGFNFQQEIDGHLFKLKLGQEAKLT